MGQRVFIAINLPETIKEELQSLQKEIEEKFSPVGEDLYEKGIIRMTKPENLHITLIFLGNLQAEQIAKVCQGSEDIAQKYQAFSVNLNKICYGPPKKMPPRMVWIKGEKSEKLSSLKDELERNIADSGVRFSQETRGFSPHITLARTKPWLWRQIEPEERPEIAKDISLDFTVNSIDLMESKLKREGPEYQVLESFSLKP